MKGFSYSLCVIEFVTLCIKPQVWLFLFYGELVYFGLTQAWMFTPNTWKSQGFVFFFFKKKIINCIEHTINNSRREYRGLFFTWILCKFWRDLKICLLHVCSWRWACRNSGLGAGTLLLKHACFSFLKLLRLSQRNGDFSLSLDQKWHIQLRQSGNSVQCHCTFAVGQKKG